MAQNPNTGKEINKGISYKGMVLEIFLISLFFLSVFQGLGTFFCIFLGKGGGGITLKIEILSGKTDNLLTFR